MPHGSHVSHLKQYGPQSIKNKTVGQNNSMTRPEVTNDALKLKCLIVALVVATVVRGEIWKRGRYKGERFPVPLEKQKKIFEDANKTPNNIGDNRCWKHNEVQSTLVVDMTCTMEAISMNTPDSAWTTTERRSLTHIILHKQP